ncbi:MAG: tetratricopeptide repeat protein [Nitrospirae bacterium]|nr:tetratricopeptide repeat protein [Nitrospirota bacterium]MBF0534165.1 tetratricopeptide repeat protein [Nitrospirota bacterium]MBF0617052.1 tetratricopeptide repeat protein [Nitrospirota bacterium]
MKKNITSEIKGALSGITEEPAPFWIKPLSIPLFILSLTAAVYFPVIHNGFISYDDINYVIENPVVIAGLTLNGFVWALKSVYFANWHPATWILYMTEAEVFGINPQGFHFVSMLLHGINGLLLFMVLQRLSKEPVPAFWAAMLFVVHPLNVESVAWVSQQKTLLSTTFWFLALLAYAVFVEKPKVLTYIVITVLFIIGLMAKPMLVTFPVTLLILDFYPLKRFHGVSFKVKLRIICEKIPLFIITAAASLITVVSQKQSGAIVAISDVTIPERLINGITSYAGYIKKMFYPVNLSVFYPYSDTINYLTAGIDLSLLTTVAVISIDTIKRAPYIAAGFLWYVVTLLPVSQIVQIGGASISDRYAYVPLIGLFIALATGAWNTVKKDNSMRKFFAVSAFVIIITLGCISSKQLSYWRDSGALFKHSIDVTYGNYVAYNEYGMYLKEKGETNAAIDMFKEGLRYAPNNKTLNFNVWDALLRAGKANEAQKHLQVALPMFTEGGNTAGLKDIAIKLLRKRDYKMSAAYFSLLTSLNPGDADNFNYLGLSYLALKDYEKAKAVLQAGLRSFPKRADLHLHLGLALRECGETAASESHFAEAVKLNPALTGVIRDLNDGRKK